MFHFIDYVYEIFTITKELDVDIGVAYAMLKADVQSGERVNTAAVELHDFDLAAAHSSFMELTEVEQKMAYAEWHDFVKRCFKACYSVYPDYDKMAEVVRAYKAGEFDKVEEEPKETEIKESIR